MNTSLVLVGMNARPLAQSAVAAGFDVVALDAFGLLDDIKPYDAGQGWAALVAEN